MPDLVAAIDETEDGEYLAFVVGGSSRIKSNAQLLPSSFTHMTAMGLDKDKKIEMLRRFDFRGNMLVCCVKFGLPSLKNTVQNAVNTRHCRRPANIIYSKIAYEFVYKVKLLYADFLHKNNLTVDDLMFEVDNLTIRKYLKDGGLKTCAPGAAHKIADCVAYANGHGWPVHENVKELGDSFKSDFHSRVMKALTR